MSSNPRKVGSVSMLDVGDIERYFQTKGLPILSLDRMHGIVESTELRIEERLPAGEIEAIRFGAFSYLLEVARAWDDGGEAVRACAVDVASEFLEQNPLPSSDALTREALEHFAEVIQSNAYDWEGLLIAYLDPEAARLDRLRQNLRLTPTERLKKREKLIAQLKGARRVE